MLTEADSHLGLTNRLLAPFARRVCLAFPIEGRDSSRYLVTGRPVPPPATDRPAARARFGIGESESCVLVFGGSQGARSINRAAVEAFAGARFRVLHAAGERDLRDLGDLHAPGPHYDLRGYISSFGEALLASDLVVARAGGSIFEIAAHGKPAVLVPYPYATADHQTANASFMERAGAAVVIPDSELTPAAACERGREPARRPGSAGGDGARLGGPGPAGRGPGHRARGAGRRAQILMAFLSGAVGICPPSELERRRGSVKQRRELDRGENCDEPEQRPHEEHRPPPATIWAEENPAYQGCVVVIRDCQQGLLTIRRGHGRLVAIGDRCRFDTGDRRGWRLCMRDRRGRRLHSGACRQSLLLAGDHRESLRTLQWRRGRLRLVGSTARCRLAARAHLGTADRPIALPSLFSARSSARDHHRLEIGAPDSHVLAIFGYGRELPVLDPSPDHRRLDPAQPGDFVDRYRGFGHA